MRLWSEPYIGVLAITMKKIRKENSALVSLIKRLEKEKQPIWRAVALELAKPRRKKVEVNLSKIEKYANDGSTVLVPGKVLGSGNLTKKVTIAAFSFSESAQKLIMASGSKMMSIEQLLESNPKGEGVLLLK
jgi:large subunit ribosomal protein L18e